MQNTALHMELQEEVEGAVAGTKQVTPVPQAEGKEGAVPAPETGVEGKQVSVDGMGLWVWA